MGLTKTIAGLSFVSAAFLTSSALAGGFDRGAVNIDQLFDEDRFSARAGVTYVNPQRTIKNITGGPFAGATTVDIDGDYYVPRFGAKVGVTDGVDCLATYTEPFGGDAEYGINNGYSGSAVEFYLNTQDYGLTCSYRSGAGETQLGESFFRLIGGVSYMEAEGFQSRQLAPGGLLGTFDIEDESFGWRAGVAYEIPAIALNATILYSSAYDLDFTGIQDVTSVLGPGGIRSISLDAEIPQALDIKFQTGINETTLAFLNMRWQDWSELGILPVVGGVDPRTSLDLSYQDGYTLTAGIGKQVTEDVSTLISLTWDQGTSTIVGTQSDTWTLAGGVRIKRGPNFRLSLGGAVGILEGGTSGINAANPDPSAAITYNYDADFVYALTASAKFRF